MIVIDLKTGLRTELNNDMSLSCAVGNFDGVHKGHLALLQKAAEKTAVRTVQYGRLPHIRASAWETGIFPR